MASESSPSRVKVMRLGEPRHPSPLSRAVQEWVTLPEYGGAPAVTFPAAGPRERLFFHPAQTRAAIVTCGGLCPGLNNVVRSVFFELHHRYGVPEVLGFRYGYAGLDPAQGHEPLRLTTDFVSDIHNQGGTVLGTSRGPVDARVAIDRLRELRVNILFCVGGDGTLRGAHKLHLEAQRQGYPLAVIGIPKTIDNDVEWVWRTFGYSTALEVADAVIDSAHMEARSAFNGIGLVKLMGRDAGFIAAGATLANQEVNFVLIPEVPFDLPAFLLALRRRILARHHAVIVVAEGAGQHLFSASAEGCDPSGNRRYNDIGLLLKDGINDYFAAERIPIALKYFDPSYFIRSRPANTDDALLCDQLARNAVHAGMAGFTDIVMGFWYNLFLHVPIEMATGCKRQVAPDSELWQAVLSATGQPPQFTPTAES